MIPSSSPKALGHSRWPYLARLIRALFLAWCLVALLAFVFQRTLIYRAYDEAQGPFRETIVLDRDGTKVHAAVHRGEGAGALIYFGGNAEDVSDSLGLISDQASSAMTFAMHYRGYGPSEGSPSEEDIVADALALFDRAQSEYGAVTVVGRSLGAGVAVAVAAQRPVHRVVLITPFDRLATPAARSFPFLPVAWMLRDPWDSRARAPSIEAPVLVIAAQRDLVIPPSAAQRLHDALSPARRSWVLAEGVGHGDVLIAAAARDAMKSFLTDTGGGEDSEGAADDR